MPTKKLIGTTLLALFLAGMTALVWRLHDRPLSGIDDANIFFSYAENLAAGKGLSYGDNGERVEGFTSFLWMLVCALSFALGFNEAGIFVASFILFFLTQILFIGIIRKAAEGIGERIALLFSLFYLLLILSSPAYISWMTLTQMDTCLWGCLLAGMIRQIVFPARSTAGFVAASLPFVLAPIARPEAMLVAPVFIAILWLRCRSVGLPSATLRCILLLAATLTALGAITIFRLAYFGYPLPNTFYAKVSPSLLYNLRIGNGYLRSFITGSALSGICVLFVAIRSLFSLSQLSLSLREVLSRQSAKSLLSAADAVSISATVLVIVPILTGGDHFKWSRFYQPVQPVMYLAFILFVLDRLSSTEHWQAVSSRLAGWLRQNIAAAAVSGLLLLGWLGYYSQRHTWSSVRTLGSPIEYEFTIAQRGAAQGKLLNRIFATLEERPSIGVVTAGGIARTYNGRIVDLMGLNNSQIAHFAGDRKGNKNHAAFERDVFFRVEPDLMFDSIQMLNILLKGLLDDPRFYSTWRYGRISLVSDSRQSVNCFVKESFIRKLRPETGLRFEEEMVWSDGWKPAEQRAAAGNPSL